MRPHGKYASVSPQNPSAFAQCDRCGFWRNREDLVMQVYWAGQQLFSNQVLVCYDRCYDIPNEQLRTIILPPDPPPIINARVPNYQYEEQIPLVAQQGVPDPSNSNKLIPWGVGPELLLSDQSGDVVLLAQYTQSQQLGTNAQVSNSTIPPPGHP